MGASLRLNDAYGSVGDIKQKPLGGIQELEGVNVNTSPLEHTTNTEPVNPKDLIPPLVKAIQRANGMDTNQAKTVVYYAMATYALEKLNIMPILVLKGTMASGKSTTMTILEQITSKPVRTSGSMTKPVMRDAFKPNTTALIEEADQVDEQLLTNRYAKNTATLAVNKPIGDNKWKPKKVNTFGATVLHRRRPFKDPAVKSRSIQINMQHKPGSYETPYLTGKGLEEIANQIQWDTEILAHSGKSRSMDTWTPLLIFAIHLKDDEWIDYAKAQIGEQEKSLQDSLGVEPSQAVFETLLFLASHEGSASEPKERVAITEIRLQLSLDKADINSSLNNWQVGETLRDLGFETRKAGGTQYVYVGGKQKLIKVARELGIEDDWLKKQESE